MQSLYTTPGLGRFFEPQVFSGPEGILMLIPQATGGEAGAALGFLADWLCGTETCGASPSLSKKEKDSRCLSLKN